MGVHKESVLTWLGNRGRDGTGHAMGGCPCCLREEAVSGGAHAGQEAGERVPVVEHEVPHAEEGDLLQAPGARVAAKGALCDAVERVVVVPLQGVLAG